MQNKDFGFLNRQLSNGFVNNLIDDSNRWVSFLGKSILHLRP